MNTLKINAWMNTLKINASMNTLKINARNVRTGGSGCLAVHGTTHSWRHHRTAREERCQKNSHTSRGIHMHVWLYTYMYAACTCILCASMTTKASRSYKLVCLCTRVFIARDVCMHDALDVPVDFVLCVLCVLCVVASFSAVRGPRWRYTSHLLTLRCCLRQVLTRLGPFFIKIGQALAIRPDILSPQVGHLLTERICMFVLHAHTLYVNPVPHSYA